MMIEVFLENDRTGVPRLYLNTDNAIRFFPTNLKDICPLLFLPTKNHIDLHQSSAGPVGFDLSLSARTAFGPHGCLSVCGSHPGCHPSALNLPISRCLNFIGRAILVEILLLFSLLIHLLRNLKLLLPKYEKLAEKSLRILFMPTCLAVHGEK